MATRVFRRARTYSLESFRSATHLKLQKPNELSDCFVSNRDAGGTGNVADGLFAIAHSLDGIARAIAASALPRSREMEALSLVMKEGLDRIAAAIEDHT